MSLAGGETGATRSTEVSMNPILLVWLYRAVLTLLGAVVCMATFGACIGLVLGFIVLAYRCVTGVLS